MLFFLVVVLDFFLVAALAFFVLLVFVLVDFLEDLAFVDALALVEDLVPFALPGKARQCALVLTPFLFTDDLRHVQLLLTEQAVLLNPEH